MELNVKHLNEIVVEKGRGWECGWGRERNRQRDRDREREKHAHTGRIERRKTISKYLWLSDLRLNEKNSNHLKMSR
jgi:hypothetical protein